MEKFTKEVKLDPKEILDLILKYPNDMELGKKIRAYYLDCVDKAKEKNNG
jgi:hypothetical protein